MRPLQEKTGARYAVFIYVRDSYASAERKAAMVAMAMLGVGLTGGAQIGYASLVDLETGRVLWFNRLLAPAATCARKRRLGRVDRGPATGFPVAR